MTKRNRERRKLLRLLRSSQVQYDLHVNNALEMINDVVIVGYWDKDGTYSSEPPQDGKERIWTPVN
jgi:hypothetical protein